VIYRVPHLDLIRLGPNCASRIKKSSFRRLTVGHMRANQRRGRHCTQRGGVSAIDLYHAHIDASRPWPEHRLAETVTKAPADATTESGASAAEHGGDRVTAQKRAERLNDVHVRQRRHQASN